MEHQLSPQNAQYLEQVVAGGIYPSKEAALDAAVAALRETNAEIPFIPDEHMEAVEKGLAESNAGLSRPMTANDWERLRQIARDAAASAQQGTA